MISFFTSLKPMRGQAATHQANSLRSWRAAVPSCEIIVFDAVEGGSALLADVGANHQLDIARNDFGTPLISAMFSEAQRLGRHSTLCYINGDIILLPDFLAAINRLAAWKTFCAISQRWDLDSDELINFDAASWADELKRTVAACGRQHDQWAMDVFSFRRGAVGSLPEFAIGRPAWDNYLIRHLLKRGIPIVDLSKVIRLIHQNHGYAHIANRSGVNWEGPEATQNRTLAADEFHNFNPRYYTIRNAQWLMLERGVVPAVSPQRLLWRTLAKFVPDSARNVVNGVIYKVQFLAKKLLKLSPLLSMFVYFTILCAFLVNR
jgi:hypothetical protein